MKKFFYALTLVIVAWLATLLYANNKTQTILTNSVAHTNAIYQQKDLGVSLKIEDFDYQIFGATVQYKLFIDIEKIMMNGSYGSLDFNSTNLKGFKDFFEKPFEITQKIQYGPVFFNEGFELGMAKTTFRATLNELLEDYFVKKMLKRLDKKEDIAVLKRATSEMQAGFKKFLKEEVLIEYSLLIPFFSGESVIKGRISKIHFSEGEKELIVAPIQLYGVSNVSDFTGRLAINIPSLSFTEKGVKMFDLEDVAMNYQINEYFKGAYFGDFSFDIKKIESTLPGGDSASFSINMIGNTTKHKTPGFSSGDFSLTLTALKYPDQPIVPIQVDLPKMVNFSMSINAINESAIVNSQREFYKYVAKISQGATLDKLIQSLEKIALAAETNLKVGVEFTTMSKPNITNSIDLKLVYNLLKGDLKKLYQLSTQPNAQQKMARFAKDKGDLFFNLKVDAQILAFVEPFLQLPINMGVIVKKDGFYQSKVAYQNAKLLVNDRDLTPFLTEQVKQQLNHM
jgi:uridine phosphorylase